MRGLVEWVASPVLVLGPKVPAWKALRRRIQGTVWEGTKATRAGLEVSCGRWRRSVDFRKAKGKSGERRQPRLRLRGIRRSGDAFDVGARVGGRVVEAGEEVVAGAERAGGGQQVLVVVLDSLQQHGDAPG